MRELQSLARGLKVLDIMVNNRRPYSVTELAEMMDVDKSSMSRLLRTMQNYGYIQKLKDDRKYEAGKRLYTIGWQLNQPNLLREAARPVLEDLVEQTGENACIAMYASGKAVVTEQALSERALLQVRGDSNGYAMSLHSSALGKCLIAHGDYPLPEHLPPTTPKSITDHQTLQACLAQIRQDGYALDDEEFAAGVRCIAVPVRDDSGVTVAAIGISGPALRMTDATLPGLIEVVKEAAKALSTNLHQST